LRTYPGMPPSALTGTFMQAGYAAQGNAAAASIVNLLWPQESGLPTGAYTWAWQEKTKGRCYQNWLLGSSHNGWGFNTVSEEYYCYTNGGDGGQELVHLSPADAALLTASQLETNAFFDMSYFTGLFATNGGSEYAQTYSNSIISSGIPAVTLPVGANHLDVLAPDGQPDRNFNMQTNFENGWPLVRMQIPQETNNWHHSDVREVAYIYTYKLFNQIVTNGNLR